MDQSKGFKKTRIVCISDTHNQTPKLPQGDVLIHAGDLTNQGSFSELEKTVKWLESTDFQAKIVVAGNHDVTLDADFYRENGAYFHNNHPQDHQACLKLIKHSPSITYLNHEQATVRLAASSGRTGPHTTFSIFGSPYSPAHGLWAFGYNTDRAASLWSDIPLNTDIVVTHTPPRDHCDTASPGSLGGCEALRRALWRVRPKLAVCGHKHPGRGVERVKWRLDSKNPGLKYMEDGTKTWDDPGAGMGNRKESRVDLTAKGGDALENCDSWASGNMRHINHVRFEMGNDNGEAEGSKTQMPKGEKSVEKNARKRNSIMLPLRDTGESEVDEASSRSLAERADVAQSTVESTIEKVSLEESEYSRLHGYAVDVLMGRMGRKETCIVNASYMATSYGAHKRFNKPIVVDIDLPVWQGDE